MAGKFLTRNAIIHTIKSQERANAQQKRDGTNNHVRTVACQCPDPDCGAFHTIEGQRPLPTAQDADEILRKSKKS